MRSLSPFPVALLVTASALALAQLAALILALRRQRQPGGHRWAWFVTALCFGTPLAVLTLLVLGVHHGRVQAVQAVAIARDLSDARLLPLDSCYGLCVCGLQKVLGGLALAATGLFGAVVTSVCWYRSDRPRSAKRVAVVAAAGLALCALAYGGGVTMTERTLRQRISDVGAIAPDQKPKLFALVLEETHSVSRNCTWIAIGAAVLATLGCALLLRRKEPPGVGPGAVVAGITVLALGLALFAATRGHASDLDGPWPICPNGPCRSMLAISRDMEEPKKLTRATPLPWAPVLEVTRPEGDPGGGVVTLDGSEVAVTRELTEDEIGARPWSPLPRLLALLQEKVTTRRQLEPDRPPPDEIILRAHRALKAPTLRPLLATCHRAGYRKVLIATSRTERFKSAVLGELKTERDSGLAVRLTTKATAPNLVEMQRESFGTLAYRLNQAAARGPVALRIEVAE